MRQLFIFLILQFAISHMVFATEIGYSRSQSSTSTSDRFNIGHKIDLQNKVSANVSLSKDTTGSAEDSKTASYKLSYRYKFLDPLILITLEGRRTDDSYFYEGNSGAIKIGGRVFKYESAPETFLETRLSLRGDLQGKTYTKDRSENLIVRTVTLGLDQDIIPSLTVGISASSNTYNSNGTLTKQALDSKTITNSDITNFLTYLSKSSLSAYVEYVYEDFLTIGLSQNRETPLFDSASKSTTNEIYLDYQAFDFLSFNVSYSQGKTEGSTTNSDTWSGGLLVTF